VDSGVIDRQKLLERAREVQAKASLGNPLMEAFAGKTPAALLDKTYKKTEPVYEKLKVDVDKTDFRVLETTAAGYEPGRMLDNLRRIASPVCIVHGMNDPILPAPSDEVWNYLQQDKDDTFLPIPLENVRHFPMLEHEPFPRLATDFLEAADLTKLEIRERWKRRSR
jgi:pimeloyl-ACP methyl ester carboxylesterase